MIINKITMKKILIISLLLNIILFTPTFSQYNNIIQINENIHYADVISNFKAVEVNNDVYLSWNSKNDTIPGHIAIYKSNNFDDHKIVTIIKNFTTHKQEDLVLQNFVKDSLEFPYDTYIIVSINDKQMLFLNDNIISNSTVAICKIKNFNRKNTYNFESNLTNFNTTDKY